MNPLLRLVPRLVESKETRLSATLDELIGLCDEFCGENPAGELSVGSDRVRSGIPSDLGHLRGRVDEGNGHLGGGVDRRGALKPVREDELCVVFPDGWGGAYISAQDRQDEEQGKHTLRGHFRRMWR